ncbi:B12-binding domain-containing radical SAM protein [bacterium]
MFGGFILTKRMPHALLINPWIVDFAAYDFWIKPLGLLTLASTLRYAQYQVTLLDCLDRQHPMLSECIPTYKFRHRFFGTGHYPKEILSKPSPIKDIPRKYGRYGLPLMCVDQLLSQLKSPDIIFITSGMTYWYPGVFDMIALCREKFSDVPIILGGIYATLCQDHAQLNSGADYVLSGPSIREAHNLAENITGFTSSKNKILTLWPAYDLYNKVDSAAIRTTIGCPFSCPFCASHLLSPGFSRRDPDDVFQEIRHLNQDLSVKDIAFYDDALLLDRDNHIIPILKTLVQNQLQIRLHTPNGLHPKWIDRKLADLMFQSGFKTLRLSYESINPDRQLAMGEKVSNSDLKNAVACLKAAGFTSGEIGGYVLMGLPNQTLEEVIESLLFVLGLDIRVSLASFSPIPGTESWKEAVVQGLIDQDMDPLLTNNSIFPMVPDIRYKKQLTKLSTLTAKANQMILRSESPISDSEWRIALKSLGDIK